MNHVEDIKDAKRRAAHPRMQSRPAELLFDAATAESQPDSAGDSALLLTIRVPAGELKQHWVHDASPVPALSITSSEPGHTWDSVCVQYHFPEKISAHYTELHKLPQPVGLRSSMTYLCSVFAGLTQMILPTL